MARATLTRSRSAVVVLLRLLGAAFAALLQPFGLASRLVFLAVLLREGRIGLREVLLIDVLVGLAWIVSSIRHYFTYAIERFSAFIALQDRARNSHSRTLHFSCKRA